MEKQDKTLIHIQDLKKQFENDEVVTKVLHGLSFEIVKGEFVAIMGPSGSGKSTLMHILGFLDRLSSGTYKFEGINVSEFDDDQLAELRNEKVGFVFQAYNLLPRTTLLENVKLPLLYNSKIKSESKRIEMAKKAIKAVDLGHRTEYFSNQLSGGEKQRVAIARALVNQPEIIFADEPTGNLDSQSGHQVMKIIEDLNDTGHTVILVTHESDTAAHAERIIQLKDGVVVSDKKVGQRRRERDGNLRK